jgi:integrase/recombinase XerD
MQIVIFMAPKTSIVLDTRRALLDGTYPIKLRVTFNRTQKYYPTQFNATRADFEKYMTRVPKGKEKQIRMALDSIEQKATSVIAELELFDFDQFQRKFYKNEQLRVDVYAYFDLAISEYKLNGQIGTASNYTCSKNSLKSFKDKLAFWEITPEFLRSYERKLITDKKSISTVGIYLRPLKAIINRAIEDGTLPKDYNYPFGSKTALKYQIPTSKNTKKALDMDEVKALFDYKAESNSWEEKALDFWKFSYMANGMNMKDISLLKRGDIKEGFIEFVRAKTVNTNRTVIPIKVYLTDELKAIIAKHGKKNRGPNTLIFTIIRQTDTLENQAADLKQFIKMLNKYTRKIASAIGIEKDCTTYTARHTTATILKRSGADIQQISEALGHASISTTKAYLGSFEDGSKKEMAKLLTAFKD